MTDAEAERLRKLEVWQAQHEELCKGRHIAIDGRFDRLERLFREMGVTLIQTRDAAAKAVKSDLSWQNGFAVIRFVILIAVVLLAGTKHPKALFDLLESLG